MEEAEAIQDLTLAGRLAKFKALSLLPLCSAIYPMPLFTYVCDYTGRLLPFDYCSSRLAVLH